MNDMANQGAAKARGQGTPAHGLAGTATGRRLLALVHKEFRQLRRDRSNLAIGLLLPIVLILIFGYGLSLDIKRAPVAVVMEDTALVARDIAAGFLGTPYLDPLFVGSMAEARKLMHARRVDGIVRFPSSFARELSQGSARVQLLLHGTDANSAAALGRYVNGAIARWRLKQADRQALQATGPGAVVIERMWFNAANTSTWYLVPGLIAIIMTLVGAFLTAMVVAREWERGTMEALFVTPVRPGEILLAKIIPYFSVGMLGFFLCLVSARFLFQVPMRGSLLVLFVSATLYLFVALGMGLLISAKTRNQFVACQVAILSSFLPALMLSGFLFDLRNVPMFIQVVSAILPVTYFMELVKASFLSGDNWPVVFKNWAILLGYALLFFVAARALTRKSLE